MNLYATLEDADTYLENVLNTEAWDLSTDVLRTKALGQATRSILALNIPEYEVVPTDYRDATIEIALKLLEGFDPEIEMYNRSVASFGFDNLKQTNKSDEVPLHIIAGIPSIVAFNLLRRYMPDINTVRLGRVD